MDAKTVARAGYRGLLKGKTLVIPGLRNWLVAESVRVSPSKDGYGDFALGIGKSGVERQSEWRPGVPRGTGGMPVPRRSGARQCERDVDSSRALPGIFAAAGGYDYILASIDFVGGRRGVAGERQRRLPQQLRRLIYRRREIFGRNWMAPINSSPPAVTIGPP